MNLRLLALIVVAFVVGSLLPRFATSQQQGPVEVRQGRFALAAVPSESSIYAVVVCDTSTGQCWRRETTRGDWLDMGSPSR
jgi:hypothetical protein